MTNLQERNIPGGPKETRGGCSVPRGQDAAAASLGGMAEGLCTLKWEAKMRGRAVSPPAAPSTKTEVTQTRRCRSPTATAPQRQATVGDKTRLLILG